MKKNHILVGICLALASCAQQVPLQSTMDSYFDPEITGQERKIISEMMATLPEEDRKEVVYIDFENHKIYANRSALKKDFGFAKAEGGASRLYVSAQGTKFALPGTGPETSESLSSQAVTCPSGGSGPYRRVRTAAGTASVPYTYAKASVQLSSGSLTRVEQNPNVRETPYAYLGVTTSTNVEADVGLQYNVVAKDWGAYIKSGGTIVTGSLGPIRYSTGQVMNLEFITVSDNRAKLRISNPSTTVSDNPKVIFFDVSGLKASGVGNRLKRVTSIAQATSSGSATQNFTTGAYYSAAWTNMAVGTTTSAPAWGSRSSDVVESCYWPNPTNVQISSISGGEKVVIDL